MNALQNNPIQRSVRVSSIVLDDMIMSIKLFFPQEPNHEAPERISELLKKSYLNRMVSESRFFE